MINLNKVASELKFIGSSIKEVRIDNNIVNLRDDAKMNISMSLNISRVDEIEHENGSELNGYLTLKLNVTAKVPEKPAYRCKLTISLEGCFSSFMEDKEKFEKMLYINGGTTLYSIARSHVLNFSSTIFMNGKILLPLINMIEYIEEMEKKELPNQ